jgi:hypothetical protein
MQQLYIDQDKREGLDNAHEYILMIGDSLCTTSISTQGCSFFKYKFKSAVSVLYNRAVFNISLLPLFAGM